MEGRQRPMVQIPPLASRFLQQRRQEDRGSAARTPTEIRRPGNPPLIVPRATLSGILQLAEQEKIAAAAKAALTKTTPTEQLHTQVVLRNGGQMPQNPNRLPPGLLVRLAVSGSRRPSPSSRNTPPALHPLAYLFRQRTGRL